MKTTLIALCGLISFAAFAETEVAQAEPPAAPQPEMEQQDVPGEPPAAPQPEMEQQDVPGEPPSEAMQGCNCGCKKMGQRPQMQCKGQKMGWRKQFGRQMGGQKGPRGMHRCNRSNRGPQMCGQQMGFNGPQFGQRGFQCAQQMCGQNTCGPRGMRCGHRGNCGRQMGVNGPQFGQKGPRCGMKRQCMPKAGAGAPDADHEVSVEAAPQE